MNGSVEVKEENGVGMKAPMKQITITKVDSHLAANMSQHDASNKKQDEIKGYRNASPDFERLHLHNDVPANTTPLHSQVRKSRMEVFRSFQSARSHDRVSFIRETASLINLA